MNKSQVQYWQEKVYIQPKLGHKLRAASLTSAGGCFPSRGLVQHTEQAFTSPSSHRNNVSLKTTVVYIIQQIVKLSGCAEAKMAHKRELSFNTTSDNLPQKQSSHVYNKWLKGVFALFWVYVLDMGDGGRERLYVRLAGLLASRVCVIQGQVFPVCWCLPGSALHRWLQWACT